MEKTWSVAGAYGKWKMTVALVPEDQDPEETYRFDADETTVALSQFASLEPHFMDLVNFVEFRSFSEHEHNGARITEWA